MCNKRLLYELFFKTASATLLEFAATPKHLGAKPGLIGILHTWGQTLIYHVHLHFIVTGGGWREHDQCWVEHKDHQKFLYPVHAMSDVFRGKFIAGLKRLYRKEKIEFPGELQTLADEDSFEYFLNRACSQRWMCYAKRPFSGPQQVLKYISGYTHKVAISNSRLLDVNDEFITFRYRDYKDGHKLKILHLSPVEFIRRFLHHVVPKRFIRIRHYGFLAGNSKAKLLPKIREYLISVCDRSRKVLDSIPDTLQRLLERCTISCPICGLGVMRMLACSRGNSPAFPGGT